MTQSINIDNNDENADWIKTLGWDLPTDPACYTQEELDELSTLPVWEAAPQELKDAQAKGQASPS